MSAEGLWVDCDPALGVPFADVDDALALIWLAASGASLAGISTVYGNSDLDRVHVVAEALGRRLGMPVVRGARDRKDRDTAAVEALVAHRGAVLALAPMTNVAAALERGASWERLVVLGGYLARVPNVRPLRTQELNFALDEDAAERVLEAGCDLVPMEPCRAVAFGPAEVAALPADLAAACRTWLWSSPLRTFRLAFHPWDLVAAAWLTDPDLVTWGPGRFQVVRNSLSRGRVARVRGSGRCLSSIDGRALAERFAERVRRWTEGADVHVHR